MDVAKRAVAVATERNQGRVVIAANKVADAEDEERLRAAFPGREIVMIPEDPCHRQGRPERAVAD